MAAGPTAASARSDSASSWWGRVRVWAVRWAPPARSRSAPSPSSRRTPAPPMLRTRTPYWRPATAPPNPCWPIPLRPNANERLLLDVARAGEALAALRQGVGEGGVGRQGREGGHVGGGLEGLGVVTEGRHRRRVVGQRQERL